MKRTITLTLASVVVTAALLASEVLTLGDITGGRYAAETMRSLVPLSDGESYAQLSPDGKQVQTWQAKTGKQTGILFDADNTIGSHIDAIDGYQLSPDGQRMLLQTKTDYVYRRSFKAVYYLYNIATRKLEPLSAGGPQQTPIFSPDGWQVAFVREGNIFLVKLRYDNAEVQVTKDGKLNEVINGIPDWVNEEEFGHNSSMVFNADGTMLCWVRYDEGAVPLYSLQLFHGAQPVYADYADYPGEYAYKYPKAGHPNAIVTAWSYDIESRRTQQLQLPLKEDDYIPRIKSTDAADRIIVLTLNRHQDQLDIYSANPRSTVCRRIVREEVPRYIKEDVLSGLLLTRDGLILPSDRSGRMQLYLYNYNGQLIRQLTDTDGEVTAVYGHNEKNGNTYFQTTGATPMQRRVCVVERNGRQRVLAGEGGWNAALFAQGYNYFIHTWSNADTPPRQTICDSGGKTLRTVVDNQQLRSRLSECQLPKKEFFSFTTSEGVTLNGVMMKPVNFNPSQQYPVLMYQYSGPGSQQVVDSWSIGSMGQGALYDNLFTQEGIIVVCVDGRGTGGRGAEFEKTTYLRIGEQEARDQVETALYLKSLPYVDGDHIGIWGWSYGGFCTLMSMSEGRDAFCAGVAVAPPTNWKYYDSIYTERFMRTPKENPDGYAVNPIARVEQMHGKLLLCHGLADDNVHPQNMFEYTDALVKADKDFRELIYTNRNHSIYGGNARKHLLRQIFDFFVQELK